MGGNLPETMRAAVYKGDRKVEVEDYPIPDVGPGDVLLEVSHCGVCGSDIHFVLEGSGWTEYDGVEHQWEAGDVIALPVKEAGIQFRHHNTGLNAARMLVTWPNFDSANGPEAGVVMQITENCPEWDAAEAAKAK